MGELSPPSSKKTVGRRSPGRAFKFSQVLMNIFRKRFARFSNLYFVNVPAVSSVAKRTLSVREVWGSIPGPVKSAQHRQRLAIAATFLRSCVAQALSRRDGPVTRYTLRRNTASIMKI